MSDIFIPRHEVMDNGEERTRITLPDGATYIRTSRKNCEGGAWQKSHYHIEITEAFTVQAGFVVYAVPENGVAKIKCIKEGGTFIVASMTHHNLYLSAKAIIHTIKYGQCLPKDWFESPELDEMISYLSWVDIFNTL